jgi:hypothetical protein
VHGGGLVAILDAATRAFGVPEGPRVMEGRLTASVPVATTLTLEGGAREGGAGVTVLQGGQILSSASVSVDPPGGARPAAWQGGAVGYTLPMSDDCLACGTRNPLGLQTALAFDEEGVWARVDPRASWMAAAGTHAALAPVLLDEVAWWLGALTMREGGLTNRIQVTLYAAALPAGPLLAAGRFADVEPVDRKRTFWRTASALYDATGNVLATAAIVFRGGPEYSERQVPFFKSRTDATTFRRMFPNEGRR